MIKKTRGPQSRWTVPLKYGLNWLILLLPCEEYPVPSGDSLSLAPPPMLARPVMKSRSPTASAPPSHGATPTHTISIFPLHTNLIKNRDDLARR